MKLKIPNNVYLYQSKLEDFLRGLNIDTNKIQDKDLFFCAFIHKSYAADFKEPYDHNERLEFLGDAILGSIIAKKLFIEFPNMEESDMTLYKIALVREEMLCKVAKKIGLHHQLFISKGEEKNGGREKASITSDALEALIGYLALDMGYSVAEKFVLEYIYPEVATISDTSVKSYKTKAQEEIQKKYKQLPVYKDSESKYDENHNVILFCSEIFVNGEKVSEGFGSNKKKAQEDAAKNYFMDKK